MLSLSLLFWLTLFVAIAALWWQSDKVKSLALNHALLHCRKLNLQFLDQTMVLTGLHPVRNEAGRLSLRRRYQFEFTVNGETRHKGTMELFGNVIRSIQLEPHVLPEQDQLPH